MGINKPQHARLLFIDEKIRSGLYPNAASMAKEYEISARTLLRDIEYMRDMLGAPVEYDNSRKGYFYAEENFFLPALDIKESDFFAICITEKALKQYENTPLYERLSSIFERLRDHLPESIRVNTTWIGAGYTFLNESHTRIDPAVWEIVSEALIRKIEIEIVHKKAGADEGTKRIAAPYHIVNYRGEWYLIARCNMRKTVVRFAMSRIESARILKNTYTIPEDFSLDSFLGSSFGIMTDDTEYDVEIKFATVHAPYIYEREWLHGQKLSSCKDGSVIISFKTNSLFEVKRWVLSWGAGAEVIKPGELIDMMQNDVKGMARVYLEKSRETEKGG